MKDFFKFIEAKKPFSIRTILRPPKFVPADRKNNTQLRSFQAKKLHHAVVLDDNGKVIGLITLEDLLEELGGISRMNTTSGRKFSSTILHLFLFRILDYQYSDAIHYHNSGSTICLSS